MDVTLKDPLVGRLLDGRYAVQQRIARGGMATVYLAVDSRLDRDVALKVMHGHLTEDPEFVARFVREARSAARLSHPNVVQVFDQGQDDGVVYLAMEHLPGRTLRDILAERGALTPREALSVVEPVLDALAAAHRGGIIHRDIKPENVLLTDDGRVKVADFGLARASTSTATTGTLVGTVAYLAPELVSRGIADARSDVYACGILLFEMLTGRPPFVGDIPIQVAFQHVHEQVPPPSDLVPELPDVLDDVVLAATAQDAADRPPDAAALLREVRAARRGLSVEALDHRPPFPLRLHTSPAPDTEVIEQDPFLRDTRSLPSTVEDHSDDLDEGIDEGIDDDLDGGYDEVDGPVDDEAAPAARRGRRRLLAAVVALVVVLGAGAWWWVAGPGAYTTAPSVDGLPAADAVAKIESMQLDAAQEKVFDDAVAAGFVVGTQPAGKDRVRREGTVVVLVSKGPQMFPVPLVTGTTREAAQTALADANLAVGPVTEAYSDTVKAGLVISTDPVAGEGLRRGKPVAIVVSKGPQPVAVPDLVGVTQKDAVAALTTLRLKPRVTTEISEKVDKDKVISQSPTSGTLLPGQSVALVVSSGPPLVEVPNVFRMSYREAKRILERAGFEVDREGTRIFDQVFETRPSRGSMAPKGSTIIVRTF